MENEGLYAKLMEDASAVCAAEDRHMLASIAAMAAIEATPDQSLAQALGLDREDLRSQLRSLFPQTGNCFDGNLAEACDLETEEGTIRELLLRFRTPGDPLGPLLSVLLARRAMRPNHLWQDLGLRNRLELSTLMMRHFAPLARRNAQDMKWKKFFYRMTCSESGFSLCAAPVCSECSDFDACFSDESGASLLARVRQTKAEDLSASDESL